MDIEDCHYEEVYSILFKTPLGMPFAALYKQCKLFPEETDLSRVLHRAGQQGNVLKKNGIYRLTTEKYKEMSGGKEPPTEEPIVEPPVAKPSVVKSPVQKEKPKHDIDAEIKALLEKNPETKDVMGTVTEPEVPAEPVREPKVIVSSVKRTEVPKAKVDVELPFGDLQRSKAMGGAALALYKVRSSDIYLTLSELSEWTGCNNIVLSQRLAVLVDRRYVEKDNSLGARKPRFKWAGNYRYPFDKYKETDDELVNFKNALAWSERHGSVKAVTVPPDQVVIPENIKSSSSGDMVTHNVDGNNGLPNVSGGHAVWGNYIPGSGIDAAIFIDLQLKSLQAQMDVLLHVRKSMMGVPA